MTAVQEPLYVRDGSRFVLYDARAQHVPPIPEPRVVEAGARPGGGWSVPAPKCPHGHFSRWAGGRDEKGRPNCSGCASGR